MSRNRFVAGHSSRTWAVKGSLGLSVMNHMRERERHRETRSKRGLLRISPLLLHSARNLARRRDTSDLCRQTSDGDYLLIIHYSYASCSKLSRYAQGDKALVTFPFIIAVPHLQCLPTISRISSSTKAYSACKHAKCPTSSLCLYQPDQIAPSRLLFVSKPTYTRVSKREHLIHFSG